MEEDKLRTLFSNFEPELTSDFQFLNDLNRNLNSVEMIKRHTAAVRSKNKKALTIAAFIGFVVGFLFSLSLPYLYNAVSNWQLALPRDSFINVIANNFTIIAWIIIGSTSVFTALNTYEISLSLLSCRKNV